MACSRAHSANLFVDCAFQLVWIICAHPQQSGWRRFAYGALSGLIGGNLYFLKVRMTRPASGHVQSIIN